MEKKIYFETLEELQKTYPIGSIFNSFKKVTNHIRYFYSSADLNCLRKEYDKIYFNDDNTVKCYKETIINCIVEGYLFDGEYWQPAYNTCDGWLPYNEDNL